MHKIGEIWVDDGSGCLVWVVLIVIVGVIGLPIMAGIWVWNAGSNLINYGTIDTETAHVRATATAEAIRAQATAIALAPVEADSQYYTHLAERANISIGPVSNLDYDANRDAIYFNIDFTNGDQQPHTINVAFHGPLGEKYKGSLLPQDGYSFERQISLRPGHNLLKIVEPSEPRVSVGLMGNSAFGGMSLLASDFQVKLVLIDGFPLQDPRKSLSELTAELFLEQPGQCFIKITNTDTSSHNVFGYVEFNYAYTDLGVMTQKSGTGEFGSKEGNLWSGVGVVRTSTVPPKQSVVFGENSILRLNELNGVEYGFWEGDNGILPDLPISLSSVTVQRVVLELSDPGTESVDSSIKTKIFTSSACDYKK